MKITGWIKQLGVIAVIGVIASIVFHLQSAARERYKPNIITWDRTQAENDTAATEQTSYSHPYLQKAESLNNESLYDSAIYYYAEAAGKFEKENNWRGYVWANINVANLYLSVESLYGQFPKALPYLESALEKGQLYLGNQHPFIGTIYYYLGIYYEKKNDQAQALQMLNQALKIRLAYFGNKSLYVARIYEAIGKVYTYIGFDYSMAEKYYDQSLAIKEQVIEKNKSGINASGLFESYYNLISVNQLKGDYEKALSYCFEAIRRAEYLVNLKNERLAHLHGVMGDLYKEQGQFQKAIEKLNQAIDLNLHNTPDTYYLLSYYNSLGDIYNRLANYGKAVDYYKLAIKIMESDSDYDSGDATNTYLGIGMALLHVNQFNASYAHLKKCINLRKQLYGSKHPETATAYQYMGHLFQQNHLLDSALQYYQQALLASIPRFKPTSVYSVPATSLINKTYVQVPKILADKAWVLTQLYTSGRKNPEILTTAFAYFCLSDTLVSLLRRNYSREVSKLAFIKDNQLMYEHALESAFLLYQQSGEKKYVDRAFHFMDKRKSGLLLDALHEDEIIHKIGISEEFIARLKSLQKEMYYIQSIIDTLNNQEKPDENHLQKLHIRLQTTEKKADELQKTLSGKNPEFFQNEYWQDTISIGQVIGFSRKNNAMVLEYFWGDSAIYIVGIYGNNVQLVRIKNSKSIQEAVGLYNSCLLKGYSVSTKAEDFQAFQNSALFIFENLVKPIRKKLIHTSQKSSAKLIIIPDGPLLSIPFESLLTALSSSPEVDYSHLPYLLNAHIISYDYSARFLLRNDPSKKNSNQANVLAFSFSKENNVPGLFGTLKGGKSTASALPGTARELSAISSVMPGKFYMGEEATEDIFKKEAPLYDILHLALHGEADSTSFYNSRLIFNKNRYTSNDGDLYMYELLTMKLPAKLAVLSACETGIGRQYTGEGVYSIARGFVSAGCPSVLMSLWKVNDFSTAELMTAFYQALSAGTGVDASVRKAKLQYLANADVRTAHPVNWAAFIPVGDMEPMPASTKNDFGLVYLLLATGITAVAVVYIRKIVNRKKRVA